MLSDIAGLMTAIAPVIGLLAWRLVADQRQRVAWLVRADVHAEARRALDGDSLLAIEVRGPSMWAPGEIRLSTPQGYESLIGDAARALFDRVPPGYDVVIDCGGAS